MAQALDVILSKFANPKQINQELSDLKNYLQIQHIRGRSQNLAFFDHLPSSVYIFYGMIVYKKSIFLTTYPPPLVNVVCERPLMLN